MNSTAFLCKCFDSEKKGYVTYGDILNTCLPAIVIWYIVAGALHGYLVGNYAVFTKIADPVEFLDYILNPYHAVPMMVPALIVLALFLVFLYCLAYAAIHVFFGLLSVFDALSGFMKKRVVECPQNATPEEMDVEDEVQCGVCGRWYPYGSYHECPEVDEE
ncbi:hypothetical protein [Methanolobus tindarius]|uniref:hypothetical protein n=1 Tax=Methanolobus tindarius TaxID=2221 RepID=UPI00064EA2CB|nr:hypothetical protein [Methanolobus tindarius]